MKKTVLFISLVFFTLKCQAQINEQSKQGNYKPFVLGNVYSIHSNSLNEDRILNIYLPEGYNATDTLKYPVIYLLDGSADEDFIHIVGLVQFYSFEWVNLLPKSIVVGIATVDRRRDFTFPTTITEEKKAFPTSGQSQKFIKFIESELQPFVKNKFKTTDSKTLIGQSLGGLLATEILISYPALFNNYIIVSPSLWWNNGSILEEKVKFPYNVLNQPITIYVGVGKEGISPGKANRVMEVDANILADKLQLLSNERLHVIFDYLPQESHATIMHQAVLNAFKIMCKK